MKATGPDPIIDAVTAELRRPPEPPADFDARLMRAVHDVPAPRRPDSLLARLTRPRTVRVSPLTGMALAAGLAGLVAVGTWRLTALASPDGTAGAVVTTGAEASGGVTHVRFVLVAPGAARVTVVGDFNDWQVEATPMQLEAGGIWSATVPLQSGRHLYAFVLDGETWVADPLAPRAGEDDFGTPNSVLTVGESAT